MVRNAHGEVSMERYKGTITSRDGKKTEVDVKNIQELAGYTDGLDITEMEIRKVTVKEDDEK